jgi:membrane protein implicated in regulation of membrane protease activity
VALLIACLIAFTQLDGGARWMVIAGGAAIEIVEAIAMVRWSRRGTPHIGRESLIDRIGVTATACRPEGRVRIHGETWSAHCTPGCDANVPVRVVGVSGLELNVVPVTAPRADAS